MRYRPLGKADQQVSQLGFGAMRLPVLEMQPDKINETEANKLIQKAIEEGINYIDTAYPYHGTGFDKAGESEPFLGRALKGGYREKVKLATKLPTWLVESREDMERILNEQLDRLQTEKIDFYLLHALNRKSWEKLKRLGVKDFLHKAVAEGKVGDVGFSHHDDFDTFRAIVDDYDWGFCQIQFNYLDENYQAGLKGLRYAGSKGLGVVVMSPLKGGNLLNSLPEKAVQIIAKGGSNLSPADLALRWIWNHPQVTTVLSGMSDMTQLEENLASASKGAPDSLSAEELSLIQDVKKVFSSRIKIDCTSCGYCMPCPAGVDIPQAFSYYNKYFALDESAVNNRLQVVLMHTIALCEELRAENCTRCGKCESHCPQNIPIMEKLSKVAAHFENAPERETVDAILNSDK